MRTPRPTPERLMAAANAVTEYALISLEAPFLRWEKALNLGVAELVWNSYPGRIETPSAAPPQDPAFHVLVDRLTEARRERWPTARWFVLGLDVHREGGDIVFTFDLSWDAGRTLHPCEMAVDWA